ncbi:MAG: hypothetical protein JWP63_219 [Candidatus Solibacter sp.]|nr:hypothetical protein [Candidatus Solibacter sp.]
MKRLILPVVLFGALLPAVRAEDIRIDRIIAVAKSYFRDSTEIPMDVAVTTVVTDKQGKPKQKAQTSVRMVFNGYSQQSGKFSLHASSGVLRLRCTAR